MSPRRVVDPTAVAEAVRAVTPWLRDAGDAADPHLPAPARAELARAVRATAEALAAEAPGHAVEVRVPPFVAVQCVDGPRHTRGTPPNVVETDARTWLELATGALDWDAALAAGRLSVSGTRAGEVARSLPVVRPLG